MGSFSKFILFFIIHLASQFSLAASIAGNNCRNLLLFDYSIYHQKQIPQENTLDYYKGLKPGDKFTIQNQIFEFQKLLGSGRTTIIIDIGEGKALRIPKLSRDHSFERVFTFSMDFVILQQELKAAGVRVPQLYLNESLPPYFLVIENTPVEFNLKSFLNPASKIDSLTRSLALQALYEFAESTWMYSRIGDFNSSQLIFDGTKWVLLDFAIYGDSAHRPLHNFKSKENIFSSFKLEDPDLGKSFSFDVVSIEMENEIKKIISKKRNKMEKQFQWLTRIKPEVSDYRETHLIDRLTINPLPPGQRLQFLRTTQYHRERKLETKILTILKYKKTKDEMDQYKIEIEGKKYILYLITKEQPDSYREVHHFVKELTKKGATLYSFGDDYAIFEMPEKD